MKISRVAANNRRRCFVVETAKNAYEFPFSLLALKPTKHDPTCEVFVDRELAGQGFTYKLKSGKEDSVLLDQVLAVNQDPEYLRRKLLYDLSCLAQRRLKEVKISKRALARRLKTPPAQLYRLLNQTFYGKTIDQMAKLLLALGTEIEFSEKAAA